MKLCRKDMQERMFFLVGSIIPLSFLIHFVGSERTDFLMWNNFSASFLR